MTIHKYKDIDRKLSIPIWYLLGMAVLPIGTVIILWFVFEDVNLPNNTKLVCLCIGFIINAVPLYFQKKFSDKIYEQTEVNVITRLSRFYEKQDDTMKKTMENIKIQRHDINNKLSALYAMAEKGQNKEIICQLKELVHICNGPENHIHSGNISIDGILNYKLQEIKEKQISITDDITVPTQIDISIFDMAVILGNLLDNAIEATDTVEDKWIDIQIRYTKGRLLINISNSYDGMLYTKQEGYISRKEDKKNHGIGIDSVRFTLKKYQGQIKFIPEETKFTAKVLVYLPED